MISFSSLSLGYCSHGWSTSLAERRIRVLMAAAHFRTLKAANNTPDCRFFICIFQAQLKSLANISLLEQILWIFF